MWLEKKSMDNKKSGFTLSYFQDLDIAFIIGGKSGVKSSKDIFTYDLSNDAFMKNKFVATNNYENSAAVCFQSFIFLFGGSSTPTSLTVFSTLPNFDGKFYFTDTPFKIENSNGGANDEEELIKHIKKFGIYHLYDQLKKDGIKNKQDFSKLTKDYFIDLKLSESEVEDANNAIFKAREEINEFHDTMENVFLERVDIKPTDVLGKGEFGRVYKGMWLGTTPVAVKVISGDVANETEKEAAVLKRLKHPNLSVLYGLYTHPEDGLCLVVDLMEGSLDKFFLRSEESKGVFLPTMLLMARDTLSGMSYLESMKIVHRDLALRNLLFAHAAVKIRGKYQISYTVKVSDFGLSRITTGGEYAGSAPKFPKRWTAPEAAKSMKFNHKSDVWSFGVTFWEILSRGATPYSKYSSADTALKHVINGERLEMPAELAGITKYSKSVFNIIKSCWNDKPEDRPSFSELYAQVDTLYQEMILDTVTDFKPVIEESEY